LNFDAYKTKTSFDKLRGVFNSFDFALKCESGGFIFSLQRFLFSAEIICQKFSLAMKTIYQKFSLTMKTF